MTTVVSTPSKSQSIVLLALSQCATATVTVGSSVDVSAKMALQVFIKMGRTVATALGNQLAFRLEASARATNNDEWYPVIPPWTSVEGKITAISSTLNGATTAGNTTSLLASGTGFTAGQKLYFRETGTPANSEWSRMVSLSTNTVTLEEAQTRNHTNGIAVTSNAEFWSFDLPVLPLSRLRLVVDAATNASGQTVDVIAWLNSLDSIQNN